MQPRGNSTEVSKKKEERDTAENILEILLNRFGSGMKGHQAMMRFQKKKTKSIFRRISNKFPLFQISKVS